VRKTVGTPATQTTAYRYDLANQLTEVRNGSLAGALLESYQYDHAGQMTRKTAGATVTDFGYDSFGRLASVSGPTTASFGYDHQGRRIRKTENGQSTHYRYLGDALWSEAATAGGAPSAVYVQGGGTDRPLARLTGATNLPTATAAYYHQDGLGSVLALSNAAGTATGTQRFDAFGAKLGGSGTVPTYGYTGREPDATGLMYYRARYYDPGLGRFTQRDPIGLTGGINRYAYVGNDPVNFTDPEGLLARQVGDTAAHYYNAYGGTAADLGVGFTPAGVYADVYGAATGKTLFGGQELSGWERALGLIPGVSEVAGVVKGVNRVGDVFDVAKGTSVLGKYPDYINVSDELGAKRFSIPTDIWNKMSSTEQWAANEKFLDRMILRGDDIVLSNPVKDINDVTGSFRRELEYLIERGFKLSPDGTKMVKR
jgi:RHS repeat-associated protein